MSSHALLSASSAERWLNCPPSARLNEKIEAEASIYASEGTDAHALAEYKLKKALGVIDEGFVTPKSFNLEMDICTSDYVDLIIKECRELLYSGDKPNVYVEQKLDFSKWVPGGFGTVDSLVISPKKKFMHVIDFKYGKGVKVSSENNAQMMCYALGALVAYGGEIDEIKLTIFQPRIDNISSWTISRDNLYRWATNTLAPIAELAYAGKGNFKAGPHCTFCKAKPDCNEYKNKAKYDFMED